MAKVRVLSDTQQQIAFTEHDFYPRYVESFKKSELGRIKSLLPLREVAFAFLKMYTGMSAPKLMEALNGNIHYQIFCGIRISPEHQLTNYKLLDSILLEPYRCWEG